ncbi:MAG: sugar nucleotide-binding protein [Candidatus Omnitrophota bacterium]|jgi:dTDP-4-dehydrorhamnose reductase
MKNKILILGTGFIGQRLQGELKCDISNKKIYSYRDAEQLIRKFRPDILINCIGYIGRNVDDCELNKDKALLANTFVPIILAEAALRHGIKLIHIGSGCIYHFNYRKARPIRESDPPDFFELYYSRTKIYAERSLEALSAKHNILVLRIRIPLDNRPHPRNILTKLTGYKNIIDLPNSITYIPDFIKALRHLIRIDARGIFNLVNKGGGSYPELLNIYKKYVPDFKYKVINYNKLNLTRTNLIMSTRKLKDSGFKVRGIREVMEECVKEYIKY